MGHMALAPEGRERQSQACLKGHQLEVGLSRLLLHINYNHILHIMILNAHCNNYYDIVILLPFTELYESDTKLMQKYQEISCKHCGKNTPNYRICINTRYLHTGGKWGNIESFKM